MSKDSQLTTSYTTPFYHRLEFSTRRNSSTLELLAYLAIGMIRSGIPCTSISIPVYDVLRNPASGASVLTACLLWSPARWAVKTLNLQLKRNSNFLLFRNYLSLLYSLVRGLLPPRIWDRKLVFDVSASPDFRQC